MWLSVYTTNQNIQKNTYFDNQNIVVSCGRLTKTKGLSGPFGHQASFPNFQHLIYLEPSGHYINDAII